MMDNDLKLEKHDDQHGLDLLFDEWLALMEDVPNRCFYHYPDWFRAYFTSRDRVDPPISFFAVRRGPVLVAVIPLQRTSRRKIVASTQLFLPVESQLYLPDVAVAAAEDPGEIIAFLLDTIGPRYGWTWDRFIVAQALEDSLIAKALERQVGRTLRTRNIGLCSVVPVRPYDETLKLMKAKFRQNLRRSRNMTASIDNAEFAVIDEIDDVLRTFEEFIELEACGWKGGKGTPRGYVPRPLAIALNGKKRRFYESAIRSFAERGAVEISCLRAEGKLIGAVVWLVFGDACFALKMAYDESFSRMSPGVMAFDLGYRHQAAVGNTSKINTITSTPAIDHWLPEKLQIRKYDLFNSTLRGRFFAAAATIRDLLRSRSGDA